MTDKLTPEQVVRGLESQRARFLDVDEEEGQTDYDAGRVASYDDALSLVRQLAPCPKCAEKDEEIEALTHERDAANASVRPEIEEKLRLMAETGLMRNVTIPFWRDRANRMEAGLAALRADNERLRVENGELRLLLREAAGQLDCWMTHAMADRLLSQPPAEGVEG